MSSQPLNIVVTHNSRSGFRGVSNFASPSPLRYASGGRSWALGQLRQAIDSYRLALEIDPTDPTANAAKAACEAQLNEDS